MKKSFILLPQHPFSCLLIAALLGLSDAIARARCNVNYFVKNVNIVNVVDGMVRASQDVLINSGKIISIMSGRKRNRGGKQYLMLLGNI
ncbi:MAG: hypothetical protein R2825_15395 [Saprospiraceae bacterium]